MFEVAKIDTKLKTKNGIKYFPNSIIPKNGALTE
jgi:hypothetical protein